jgi:hypothetical protein
MCQRTRMLRWPAFSSTPRRRFRGNAGRTSASRSTGTPRSCRATRAEPRVLCSADPVCSENLGGQGSRLANLAACHACVLLPETSCETVNQGLDRAMIVGTPDAQSRAGWRSCLKTSTRWNSHRQGKRFISLLPMLCPWAKGGAETSRQSRAVGGLTLPDDDDAQPRPRKRRRSRWSSADILHEFLRPECRVALGTVRKRHLDGGARSTRGHTRRCDDASRRCPAYRAKSLR